MAPMFCIYPFILSLVIATIRVAAHPYEQRPQHVMAEEAAVGEPLPQSGEAVREKLKKAEIIPTVIDDFLPSISLHASWSSHIRAELGNTLDPSKLHDEPTITLHDIPASLPDKPVDPSVTPSVPHDDSKKHKSHANTTYIVILTDPDAPSRNNPKFSEYCHWIAWGRAHHHHKHGHHHHGPQEPPCDPKDPTPCPPMPLKELHEVVRYKGPTPPEKTGPHRYVLLAFVPSNGTTEDLTLSKPKERPRWGYEVEEEGGKHGHKHTKGVREWARENGLSPVVVRCMMSGLVSCPPTSREPCANFIYAQNHHQ
ncbi:hypothetical protein VTJ49DRAFT_469 [Mycothermus thermophilus]|uniref:PEBP-like protein n=1 Tax=Humicola insolens TaxID=85995 RepID=A0ABR3VFJ0_HUMIN